MRLVSFQIAEFGIKDQRTISISLGSNHICNLDRVGRVDGRVDSGSDYDSTTWTGCFLAFDSLINGVSMESNGQDSKRG